MSGLDRPFRSLSPEEQQNFRIAKGVDLILGAKRGKKESWIKNANQRKKALDVFREYEGIKVSQQTLADAIGILPGGLKDFVDTYTGKHFEEGGREILRGILERFDELDKKE